MSIDKLVRASFLATYILRILLLASKLSRFGIGKLVIFTRYTLRNLLLASNISKLCRLSIGKFCFIAPLPP